MTGAAFVKERDCQERLAAQSGELARRAAKLNRQRKHINELELALSRAENRLDATIERCALLLTAAVHPG